MEKKPDGSDEHNEDYERNLLVNGLMKMVEKLYTRLDDMEKNIGVMVGGIESNLEAKLVAKLEEKYGQRLTFVEEQVGPLENQIKRIKERFESRQMENSNVKDGNSKVFQDQDVTSPVCDLCLQHG